MQYYPFSVAVGASHHVLARGNFLRYYEALTGTANPTLEIKPMGSSGAGSSEFLLRPGQSMKLPVSVPGFMIENFDGIATITGRLLVGEGDFNDSQISGDVTISGTVAVTESAATSKNSANTTIGTADQFITTPAAGAKRFIAKSRASNTADMCISFGGVSTMNDPIRLSPGDVWIEDKGAALSVRAIAGAAGQLLDWWWFK